jgi:ABC-2 type transport system ATP-binding protein
VEPVIAVEDLHKTFRPEVFGPPVRALRGIGFEVHEGECVGYLGPNGAGKTTTLKVLTGLMTPTQGSCRMLGHDSRSTRARAGLGYLPENPYFYEHLTPVEALSFYGRLSGLTAREARDRAPELLERVRLAEAAKRRIRGFSKGMRQRFGLAAALILEPQLLLLDEPLSGLDPTGRQLVKRIVLEERRKGRTVFLCSHVLADVQELCDRVIVLNHGRILRDGQLHELLDSEPESFELVATAVPEALRAQIEEEATLFRHAGDTITARLAGATRGPELAAEVVAQEGRVLSLAPQRETLEQWFVRMTGQEAPA